MLDLEEEIRTIDLGSVEKRNLTHRNRAKTVINITKTLEHDLPFLFCKSPSKQQVLYRVWGEIAIVIGRLFVFYHLSYYHLSFFNIIFPNC